MVGYNLSINSKILLVSIFTYGSVLFFGAILKLVVVHDPTYTYPVNIERIIKEMSIEDKLALRSGSSDFKTKEFPKYNIKSFLIADGPSGLRIQTGYNWHTAKSAICYPCSSALAAAFDRTLVENMASSLAEDFVNDGINYVLAPGANIKRNPLCGRNFEYFSEDPYLSSHMAASYIKGVQNYLPASIKHFACNNQETNRTTSSSEVDMRTLREIYLASFEYAVKAAKPASIMAAYNKVNGVYATENKDLLINILRKEWGYDGLVISDWRAVKDRVASILNGVDFEMPYSDDTPLINGFKKKLFSVNTVNEHLRRYLRFHNIIFSNRNLNDINNVSSRLLEGKYETPSRYDKEFQSKRAYHFAREGIILLKNEDNILPLYETNIAFIGRFAVEPHYKGSGSGFVNASVEPNILEKAREINKDIKYAPGYHKNFLYQDGHLDRKVEIPEVNEYLEEAIKVAESSKQVVVFVGHIKQNVSESIDLQSMSLHPHMNELIEKIAEVNRNIIVVLCVPSAIEMSWIKEVKGVILSYFGGEGIDRAMIDILYGRVSPSGRLPETFPIKYADVPCSQIESFPGVNNIVSYNEGIFVGYRYYLTKSISVLYPFGYGLSYTRFTYSKLRLSRRTLYLNENNFDVRVRVRVKNVGSMDGKEVVQLYVGEIDPLVERPKRELKNFEKVFIPKLASVEVVLDLDFRSFSYWSTVEEKWVASRSKFAISICSDANTVILEDYITIV